MFISKFIPKLVKKQNLKRSYTTFQNNSKSILGSLTSINSRNSQLIVVIFVTLLSLSIVSVSANTFAKNRIQLSNFSIPSTVQSPAPVAQNPSAVPVVQNFAVVVSSSSSSDSSTSSSEASSESSSSSSSQSSSSIVSQISSPSISNVSVSSAIAEAKIIPAQPELVIEKTVEKVVEKIEEPAVTPTESEPVIQTPPTPQVIETPQPVQPEVKSLNSMTYREQIQYWCGQYGCNGDRVTRVMVCESGGRSNAYGPGGYIGLFQFSTASFWNYSRLSGILVTDPYNGSEQVRLATWMYSNGYAGSWPNC